MNWSGPESHIMTKVPALFCIRSCSLRFLLPLLGVLLFVSSLSGQNIWLGQDGLKTTFWSGRNIRVLSKDAKDPVFDLYSNLEAAAHRDTAKISNDKDWAIDWRVHVLSSVAGILCLREEYAKTFGDEDQERRSQFRAYDLDHSKANKPVAARITDLFPESSVYQALSKEPRIAASLAASHTPGDIAALLHSEGAPPIKDHDCQFAVGSDFLESFAFFDYSNGQSTIHFGLPNVGSDCMGETLEIEIKLDTPQRLRAALEAASHQQGGFLADGLDHINPGNNPTLISFSHKHKEPKKKKS